MIQIRVNPFLQIFLLRVIGCRHIGSTKRTDFTASPPLYNRSAARNHSFRLRGPHIDAIPSGVSLFTKKKAFSERPLLLSALISESTVRDITFNDIRRAAIISFFARNRSPTGIRCRDDNYNQSYKRRNTNHIPNYLNIDYTHLF